MSWWTLFADGVVDPHTLGGGALVGTLVLAAYTLTDKFLASRERNKKLELETAKEIAKTEADKKLAETAAALAVKVEVNQKHMEACEDAHKKTTTELVQIKTDLAACTEKHNSNDSRIASVEQSVNAVALAVSPKT